VGGTFQACGDEGGASGDAVFDSFDRAQQEGGDDVCWILFGIDVDHIRFSDKMMNHRVTEPQGFQYQLCALCGDIS
jgi:hypothetical protein